MTDTGNHSVDATDMVNNPPHYQLRRGMRYPTCVRTSLKKRKQQGCHMISSQTGIVCSNIRSAAGKRTA